MSTKQFSLYQACSNNVDGDMQCESSDLVYMPSFIVFTESPVQTEFRLLGSDQYGTIFYVYQNHDDVKH